MKKPYLTLDGTTDVVMSDISTAVTGDLTVIAKIRATDWTPAAIKTIAAHDKATATNRAWAFSLLTTGVLRLTVYPADGTTAVDKDSTVALHTTAGLVDNVSDIWVKVFLDVNNGAAGYDVKFYYSVGGVVWTQLGTTVTTATAITGRTPATTTYMSIGALTDASLSWAGRIYEVYIYSVAALVAHPQFNNPLWSTGDTVNDDPQGNTWTLTNALVVGYEADLSADMPYELEAAATTGLEPTSMV